MKLFTEKQGMVAVEEVNYTNSTVEQEYVCYATIGNPNGLDTADTTETQEDIVLGKDDETKTRLRTRVTDGAEKHELTFKAKQKDSDAYTHSSLEYTVLVDSVFVEAVKRAGKTPLRKTRYAFTSEKVSLSYTVDGEERVLELPNVVYEVDVFDNLPSMCKIEVEIQDLLSMLGDMEDLRDKDISLKIKVSHLPFKPISLFTCNDTDRVKEFWDRVHTANEA